MFAGYKRTVPGNLMKGGTILNRNIINKSIIEKVILHMLSLVTLGFCIYNFATSVATKQGQLISVNLKALIMIAIFYPWFIFGKNSISKAGIVSAFFLGIPDMLPKYLKDIPTIKVLYSLLIITGILYLAIEVMKYIKALFSSHR